MAGLKILGLVKGGSTGFGTDNHNYKNGIGIFMNERLKIKTERRYCERCNVDLDNANRFQWCVHHKDHN